METFVFIIIPVVLVAFFGFGLFLYLNERKIRSNGTKTLAQVIEVKRVKQQQDVSFKLIVEFTNRSGQKIVQELSSSLSNPPKQKVPYTTPIIYLEAAGKKRQIILADNKTSLILGICISLFALAMLILFVFFALENF